jgi:hypothetical protein
MFKIKQIIMYINKNNNKVYINIYFNYFNIKVMLRIKDNLKKADRLKFKG